MNPLIQDVGGPSLVSSGKPTKKSRVYEELFRLITDQNCQVGERLPSIQTLAGRFGASVRTVHLAMEELEERGYIVKKHGAGTFIASRFRPLTMHDTVGLCMESGAHLFGELWSLLMQRLNERHLIPLGIDTAHERGSSLMARLRHTDAGCYLVHTSDSFPYELFLQSSFQSIPVIAFITWRSEVEWPSLYRVLTDFSEGGRIAAEHLWTCGHRHVLILGTNTDMTVLRDPAAASFSPGFCFVSSWEALGGTWEALPSVDSDDTVSRIKLDGERLESVFRREGAPTAVFGTRDVEIWQAQQQIRERLPDRIGNLAFLGFFDTPWSQTGQPPFSTVNLDLPSMADASMGMLDALRRGRKPEHRTVKIVPRLIVRQER